MSIGIWQLVLILVIVFVIFGAGKLPRVMGDVGKGIRSLKDGLKAEDDKSDDPKKLSKDTSDEAVDVTASSKKEKEDA